MTKTPKNIAKSEKKNVKDIEVGKQLKFRKQLAKFCKRLK